MADDMDRDSDRLSDSWLTSWEDQCSQEWERNSNMDDTIQTETEHSSQRLWVAFQNAASGIAQLYRGCDEGTSLWVPFQNSAGAVTLLYKNSLDIMKRSMELGIQYGHHRRNRDLLAWAKKRRRHIRREDLIAHLCGKSAPPKHKPNATCTRGSFVPMDRSSPRLQSVAVVDDQVEPDLRTFRDALALQGLNGAMSNVSVGYRPHSHQTPPPCAHGCGNVDDLHLCILDELSHHCDNGRKRNSSPADVRMDSPTRKRSRLY